jgi:hypothetical protein
MFTCPSPPIDPCSAFSVTDTTSFAGIIVGHSEGFGDDARVTVTINNVVYVGRYVGDFFQISGIPFDVQQQLEGQSLTVTLFDPTTGCEKQSTVAFSVRTSDYSSCSGTGVGIDSITSSAGQLTGTTSGLGNGNAVWTTIQGRVYSTVVIENAFTFTNIPESVYSTFATLGITVSASNGTCVDNDNHTYQGTGQSAGGGGGGGSVATGCVFEATSGQIAFEAEDTELKNNWQLSTARSGFTGSGHLVYQQPTLSINVNQNDVISYTINVSEAGNYRLYIRNSALYDEAPDKNNDLWVRHSGGSVPGQTATAGSWHKLYRSIPGPNTPFDWQISIDPNEGGGNYWMALSAGVHTLEFAGRSGQFYVDAVALLKDGTGDPNAVPKLSCVGSSVNLTPLGKPAATGRFTPDDLLSIHYDSAPDPDDIHASAAGACVVQTYSLGSRIMVAGGAYGLRVWSNGSTPGGTRWSNYNPGVENVLNQAYGSSWFKVRGNTDGSFNHIVEFATRWKQTLDTGADVWVAEGGPSDFTYLVARYLENNLGATAEQLGRVHVVQHSEWNDQNTDPSNLAWVKANLSYVRIDNGNLNAAQGQGGTADFRSNAATGDIQPWANSNFWGQAVSGQCGALWQQARNAFSDPALVDFSDTVELLYILNISQGQGQVVEDIEDFAGIYI